MLEVVKLLLQRFGKKRHKFCYYDSLACKVWWINGGTRLSFCVQLQNTRGILCNCRGSRGIAEAYSTDDGQHFVLIENVSATVFLQKIIRLILLVLTVSACMGDIVLETLLA